MPGIESFAGVVAGFLAGAFFAAGFPDDGVPELLPIIRVIIVRCPVGMSSIICLIMRTIAESAMMRFLITGSAIIRRCKSIMLAIIDSCIAVMAESGIDADPLPAMG